MNSIKRVLPAIVLVVAACTDLQDTLTPSVQDWSRTGSVAAAPVVVYSNFGPGMAYEDWSWAIHGEAACPEPGDEGPCQVPPELVSQRFTPTADYVFAGAQIPLIVWHGGPTDHMFVLLQADADGLPGEIIWSVTMPVWDPTSDQPAPIMTLPGDGAILLRKGTHYWLTPVPLVDEWGYWQLNSIGDMAGATFATTNGGSAGPWVLGTANAYMECLRWECGESPGPARGAFAIYGVPLTAVDAVESLLYAVGALVSGGALKPGPADGLTAKLRAMIESLNQGSTTAACNQLAAFVNQVNGLVRAGKLTAEAAQDLSDGMVVVRAMTGCSG